MGAHIAVAEGEPGGLDAVGGQLLHHPPALVLPPPTAYRIPAAAEGVHDRVEVRADPQTMQGDVVSSVGNHCEFCRRVGAAYSEHELRAADASGQDHDPHRTSASIQRISLLARRPGERCLIRRSTEGVCSQVGLSCTVSVVTLKGWTV